MYPLVVNSTTTTFDPRWPRLLCIVRADNMIVYSSYKQNTSFPPVKWSVDMEMYGEHNMIASYGLAELEVLGMVFRQTFPVYYSVHGISYQKFGNKQSFLCRHMRFICLTAMDIATFQIPGRNDSQSNLKYPQFFTNYFIHKLISVALPKHRFEVYGTLPVECFINIQIYNFRFKSSSVPTDEPY